MKPSGLKIVVASSGLGHVNRGIEAWADDLATALDARGEQVILCKGAGARDRAFERVISCCIRESRLNRRLLRYMPRRLSWRLGFGSDYAIEQTTFAINLIRFLRRERADILHVQDPKVALIAQRAWKLGLIRSKTILAHGTEEPLEFQKKIQFLQHLAPWHLERAREAGVWQPTWTAIPNFIDTQRFSPGKSDSLRDELGIPRDALVVLTAAAIKRNHKRIDHLVNEFAQLRQESPEIPAWLVVAGGWETETDAIITEGKRLLGDRVRFLVRFPRSRMPELYRAANVFALCSLFEMMPIALIEATASGLPCIVNSHPILEWMTGPGGVRIDMSVPAQLQAALREILSHPDHREKLGNLAQQHCQASFSKDAVVSRIVSYYLEIMAYRSTAINE